MAPRHPSSSSFSSSAPRAPSRRHATRAHSDNYNPIYSQSSSTSSDASSLFSHASSSSSATSTSTSRRSISYKVPRGRATSSTPTTSVPVCSPETGNTKIVLPRTLARPQTQAVTPAALVAAGADLENVPLAYIIQSLKDIGPRMMATLARTTAPVPTSLPRDLEVQVVPDADPEQDLDTLPTHLLAVYARETTPARHGEARRKVTLFPTHAIVLAAHCAHLPPLPPGGKRTVRESQHDEMQDASETTGPEVNPTEPPAPPEPAQQDKPGPPLRDTHIALTLPVVPLCIPAPAMFPVLQSYLYTKRADHLLSALIPNPYAASIPTPAPSPPPISPPVSDSDSTPRPSPAPSTPTPTSTALPTLVPDAATLATQLATLHTAPTLVRAALRTHGVWADAVALGVFDERMWLTIEFTWRVLLSALEHGAAQPPADSDSDPDEEDEEDGESEKVGGGDDAPMGEQTHESVREESSREASQVEKALGEEYGGSPG